MSFTTDQQTLDDLNIFSKRGSASVYGLFNRTRTRGGAQLLEEFFRYPLSDALAINKRVDLIRTLSDRQVLFPFQPELLDTAEQYLANTDERTKLPTQERSLGDRLNSAIGSDDTYKLIAKGVEAMLDILRTYMEFPFDPEGMAKRLESSELQAVLHTSARKLTYTRIAELDLLLRFRQRKLTRELLRQVYYLDAFIAVGQVARERGFCYPQAIAGGERTVRLQGVYHPLLTTAVPNTLEITPEGNVLFLTGANMAGKSTLMKALAIAVFLAHMGLPVPAAAMEFAVMDGLYTTINLSDDLGIGASHFYAEVLRIKKIAQELSRSRNLFIVFDELFRGTNVKDAYEATIAITAAFATKTNSIFVISTHIVEAGEKLKEERDNIRFVYLPTRMKDNSPVYTYTLETGITDDRHGMVIINNEGIPGILARGRPAKPS